MTVPKARRRSVRLAIGVVVCVVLGAVTTVGVAWGIQWCLTPTPPVVTRESVPWPVAVPPDWPKVQRSFAARSFGRVDLHAGAGVHEPYVYVTRTGWPCLALYSVRWPPNLNRPRSPGYYGWSVQSIDGGLVRQDGTRWVRLPLAPLFLGFALDTALYASAWYLLIFASVPLYRAGRRRFRVSRGMCGSCGYDLKGAPNGPCPECGT